MKVIYTHEALRDLDEVLTFIGENYPAASAGFQHRLRMIEQRIGKWPESAQEVAQRTGVRVVPFIRYPYKMFTGSPMTRSRSCTSTMPRGGRGRGNSGSKQHA